MLMVGRSRKIMGMKEKVEVVIVVILDIVGIMDIMGILDIVTGIGVGAQQHG